MEHDDNKLIRSKVLEAEGIAVGWNKSRVMLNISLPQENEKHLFTWQRAAAAALLAGALIFILRPERQVKLGENKIAAGNSIAENDDGNNKGRNNIGLMPVELPCINSIKPSKRKSERMIFAPPIIDTTPSAGLENPESTRVASVTATEIILSEPVAEVSAIKEERVISAIVGVIPETKPTVYKLKGKHLKIGVDLKSEQNPVAAAAEKDNSLTARLN